MGWGSELGPTLVQAGKRLAEAVRAYEQRATSANHEAMVAARQEFDRLMEIAS